VATFLLRIEKIISPIKGTDMKDFLSEAKVNFDYTQMMRREFHQHPELSFEEFRTSEIIARELGKLGMDDIKTGVAKTGVVALLKGISPGPVILLRFDMDALPVVEETGAEYASQNPGVMHACGHDGHCAVGLTVAKILADRRNELAGTIKFVFQPAEEGLGGADLMVKEGILENPRPDYSMAIHVWNDKKVDWFGITPGPVMAAAETFRVVLKGKGGHGAAPHQTVDPIFAASQVITALQSIIARNVPPLETAVVSVTSIQGGSAFNIIPPEVELLGTIRTFDPEVRETVLERFRAITTGVSESLGCTSEIELYPITPAVNNNSTLTAKVQEIASRIFPKAVIDTNAITMGSEDFAYMVQDVPGCFVFVGSADPDKGLDAAHHHPKFDFNETALENAVALVSSVTAELLSK
jgi:amidohydrolase